MCWPVAQARNSLGLALFHVDREIKVLHGNLARPATATVRVRTAVLLPSSSSRCNLVFVFWNQCFRLDAVDLQEVVYCGHNLIPYSTGLLPGTRLLVDYRLASGTRPGANRRTTSVNRGFADGSFDPARKEKRVNPSNW